MSLSCTVSQPLRDVGRKSAILTYPTCIWRPRWADIHSQGYPDISTQNRWQIAVQAPIYRARATRWKTGSNLRWRYSRGAQLIWRLGPQTNLEQKWRATTGSGSCTPSGVQGQSPWSATYDSMFVCKHILTYVCYIFRGTGFMCPIFKILRQS